MTKDKLHRYIEENKGNENNICQIWAYKDGKIVYSDTWHDYKKDDCVHIRSAMTESRCLLLLNNRRAELGSQQLLRTSL